MTPSSISLITICGLDELKDHRARGVSHVLSTVDPERPEPKAFLTYDCGLRRLLECLARKAAPHRSL